MKKIIAVFLAVLTVFSMCTVVAFAADPEETTVVDDSEERTTRNIKTDDGKFVVPINFNQLKSAFIFKLFEKIIKFFFSLFDGGEQMDAEAATGISDVFDALEERLSQLREDVSNAA